MARRETNEAKREEMKAILAELMLKGWTAGMLAFWMDVTSSCISSWKTGKSMGTNAQREVLERLPAYEPEGKASLQAKLLKRIEEAKEFLAKDEAELAALKAKAAREAVRGFYRAVVEWESDLFYSYSYTMADPVTGDGTENTYHVSKKPMFGGPANEVSIRSRSFNIYADKEGYARRSQSYFAKREADLTKFQKA
jgi:hypothetical protein